MASWNIAIVGASTLVGEAMVELLQERGFPVEQLFLLDSDEGEGEFVRFNGKNLTIESISDFDWSSANLAFFVGGNELSSQYADQAASSGCLVIDSSSHFADNPNIPLVVPYINNDVLSDYRNHNIIAIASGIVTQLLRAVFAVAQPHEVTQLSVSNLIPASFYGKAGVDELAGQSARLLNGLAVENDLFTKQLAFNLLPAFEQPAYFISEQDIVDQCRRVLGDYQLPVSVDSVNVPVFYSLAQTVRIMTTYPIMIDDLEQRIPDNYSIMLAEKDDYPTPVTELDSSLTLKIGDVRYSYGVPEQLQLWTVSDNIRYLGALMAIEAAELLINEYL